MSRDSCVAEGADGIKRAVEDIVKQKPREIWIFYKREDLDKAHAVADNLCPLREAGYSISGVLDDCKLHYLALRREDGQDD